MWSRERVDVHMHVPSTKFSYVPKSQAKTKNEQFSYNLRNKKTTMNMTMAIAHGPRKSHVISLGITPLSWHIQTVAILQSIISSKIGKRKKNYESQSSTLTTKRMNKMQLANKMYGLQNGLKQKICFSYAL